MSLYTSDSLTKGQLFAALETDLIQVDAATLAQAKNDHGEALNTIGSAYKTGRSNYSKAMTWFQLSANQNFSDAYYNIGLLYQTGKGVPQDLTTSMDYYLKGAAGNSRYCMSLIGRRFLDGIGITIDNYKALEWLERSGMVQSAINRWSLTGFQVTEQDKKKSIHQLINETEAIRIAYRNKEIQQLKNTTASFSKEIKQLKSTETSFKREKTIYLDEIQQLRHQLKQRQQEIEVLKRMHDPKGDDTTRLTDEIVTLRKKCQVFFDALQNKQNLIDLLEKENRPSMDVEQLLESKEQTISSLKRENKIYQFLVQSKDNEIDTLKKNSHLEKENRELKRRMEESTSRAGNKNNENDTISDNNNTTDDIMDLDSQNASGITVKIEESHFTPCKLENKRLKME